ncbi:hypothetical protein GOODEAATRI_021273, partial [Goodea atripinnis]
TKGGCCWEFGARQRGRGSAGVSMGEPSLDDSNVKVAVRVRPMNRRVQTCQHAATTSRPVSLCIPGFGGDMA